MFENWPKKGSNIEWDEQRSCTVPFLRENRAKEKASTLKNKLNLDFSSDVKELKEKGVLILEPFLTKKQVTDMYSYFLTKDCYDFYGMHERFSLKSIPEHVKLGRHTTEDNLRCPHMVDLVTNDKLLNMASEYLGAPATLSLLLPLWSFPNTADNPINMQLFHRDSDDYKFVKFFIFLNDVAKGEGEQIYIKGSNDGKKLPQSLYEIRRYTSNEIYSFFSKEQSLTLTGSAGTNWFADTYGIHRGTQPKTNKRLLLQLQFTLSEVPIFNYKPYCFKRWGTISELAKYTTRLYLKE